MDLSGLITAPAAGAAPQASIPDQPQYTGAITWQTGTGSAVSGNFAAFTVYKAVVTLTAKSGFTFQGVGADAFFHTGASGVSNAANSGIVTVAFPATGRTAEALVYNTWKDGVITAAAEQWYQFTAGAGKTYEVMWNTGSYGDGTKTLSLAKVSAYKSDGVTALFTDITSGWDALQSSRTISGYTGTVYLKVKGYSDALYTGTFALKYFEPGALPPQSSPRISSVSWTPMTSILVTWSSISGVSGYRVYRSTSEQGPYTQISGNITGASTTSYTDTAVSAGTRYYYKAAAYNANGEGPPSAPQSDTPASVTAAALSSDIFAHAAISAAGEADWYTFTAQASKTYLVTWNTGASNYGDGTKTLSLASVYAFKVDGTPLFSNLVNGWNSTSASLRRISNYSGTVYVRFAGSLSSSTGTYAIKYAEQ
jgi:hypothetical protein